MSQLFLEMGAARCTLLQSSCWFDVPVLAQPQGPPLPPGQGLNWWEGHAQPRPQALCRGLCFLCVLRLELEAQERGQRAGPRKGPAGGGVDASDASLAVGAAAATASPTSVPSVIWGASQTPTVCWALCGDRLAGKCLLLWGSCSDHRDSE